MDALLVRLRREQNEIESLSLPADVEIYDDLLPEYIAARKDLESSLAALNRGMADLAAALEGKRERAFEVVALPEVQLFSGCLGLDRVKQVISAHNSAGEQLSARAESARSALEQDLVAGSLEEYEGLCAAVEAAEADVQAASERKEELGSAISMLERELVEHRQPADELNADLRAYLGHEELRLAVEDTGYVLVRKAGRVGVLSEGEKTAIALLYFLKSLRDHRFALDGGVVVLDDPVSSLDANALFLAFGFIRHRVADAAQVFILTHNFAFFRQVRGWFARVKGQGKSSLSDRPSRFFMIECALADGAR